MVLTLLLLLLMLMLMLMLLVLLLMLMLLLLLLLVMLLLLILMLLLLLIVLLLMIIRLLVLGKRLVLLLLAHSSPARLTIRVGTIRQPKTGAAAAGRRCRLLGIPRVASAVPPTHSAACRISICISGRSRSSSSSNCGSRRAR